VCILAAGLFVLIFGRPGAMAQSRSTLNFDPEWKFNRADPAGASQPDFNDSGWTTVSAPHTFNDVDTFNHLSPGNMLGDTNQWSGRTWYRKTFELPESARGKRVYVEFEAVRQVAEVYLNGHLLGSSKNGFIPFGFDLTPFLRFDKPNVLAVMCDNRFIVSQTTDPPVLLSAYEKHLNSTLPGTEDAVQANQLPWNNPQWHPAMGGIYRNVRLYVTAPIHISLPLFDFLKTTGPYAYATEISDTAANIGVEVPVENDGATPGEMDVTARIIDARGNTVLALRQKGSLAADGQSLFKFSGTIENPQLWEPDYPHLYRVQCAISTGGNEVDSCEIPLGIRAVHWDIKTGFSINGHHLKLHGWGQRPTDEWPGLGTAQPDWLHFFTLQMMKDAGGNFIRWGHCGAGPEMIQAGDELGIIADQPGVDGESDTVGAPWRIRAEAFRDAVIYFRNDPSILIWEGGNQKVSIAHAEELRHFVDEYDLNGGRAYAHRRADEATGQFMDLSIGTEGSHEVARLPVVEGEYDREESPRREWDEFSPPDFGYPQAKGQTYDLTSEAYAVNEISQYIDSIGLSSQCGGANWIFSDSTSGGRNTAEVCRASGEVDGVRLPKEAYYVCQTMFRDDPRVHIIGHWNYPAGTKKTIYVTSNCSNVELFVNGKSLGFGQKSERYLFTFKDAAFAPGEIKAIASNDNGPVANDSIETAGPAVALRLTPITGPGGLHADGSDVALIDVEAIDANGRRCPVFDGRVDFSCDGPAIWRGGYDSGRSGTINNKFLDLECGINRVALRSTLTPGAISVTATAPGLRPASILVASHSFPVDDGCSEIMPEMPLVALSKTHPDWSALAVAARPMTVTSAPENGIANRRLIDTFNYTGPTELVHVEFNATNGKNVYCDRDCPFENLSPKLTGADWVQAADADKFYAAADLMQLAVKAGTTIYVAYDASLPSPDWLQRQLKPAGSTLIVGGRPMKLFVQHSRRDESFTFGSNAMVSGKKLCNMYVVFVKAEKTETTASR
jgi:beta-galactosidase